MTSQLSPYINFRGNAREAITFYQEVLGGTLTLNTFGEAGGCPGLADDKIMHAHLATERGFTLMASDLPPEMEHNPGNNITVSLTGDDGDALRGYWAKLSASGTVSMPLEKQVWGDEFGACVDKFGIPWMVNISQPQA